MRIVEVDRPALVLGSTQPVADAVGAESTGVEVLRRRSGGGAVLLEPGAQVWVDVVVATDDRLHDADVGRAFHWLGRAWGAALRDLGLEPDVHEGRFVATRLSPLVCFAGIGPGEVRIGGRKVVGISQRRTRQSSLFQCSSQLVWRPERICELLGIRSPVDRAEVATAGDGIGLSAESVIEALLRALPSD